MASNSTISKTFCLYNGLAPNRWQTFSRSSLRPIWPPSMDELITLQRLLRKELKLNLIYVVALKDFAINQCNLFWYCIVFQLCNMLYMQTTACTIMSNYDDFPDCSEKASDYVQRHSQHTTSVNILHHAYFTNRKMFLRNICRWKDIVWKSRLVFSATILQGHNT